MKISRAGAATLLAVPLFACSFMKNEPGWMTEIVLDAGQRLNCCAIGDLDPDRGGEEIVAVTAGGQVYLAWRDGRTWDWEVIATTPGEVLACTIGDVRHDVPGNELVVVGAAGGAADPGAVGAAWCIHRSTEGWNRELILSGIAMLNGVCIGDFDSRDPENEVLFAGASRTVSIAHHRAGAWTSQIACELPGPARDVAAYWDGFVVACSDGHLAFRGWAEPERWAGQDVWRGSGQTRLASFFLPGHGMGFLLVARDDGALEFYAKGTDTFDSEVIHREDRELSGAIIADLIPGYRLSEYATCGHSGRVTVVRSSELGWIPATIYEDEGRLLDLACGRPTEAETSLATCGDSGLLVVLRAEVVD